MKTMSEPGYVVADTDGMRGWDGNGVHVRSYPRNRNEFVVLFYERAKPGIIAQFVYYWPNAVKNSCTLHMDASKAIVSNTNPFAKG
jgi:hypothetical protein